MTPEQLQQYTDAFSSSAPIEMTPGGNVGLTNFFNNPSYALNYGQQAANQNSAAIANGTYNPIQAFQNSDPSYQYQIDQAMRNVNNNSAARGLLESGQTQRDLLTTAQGLQNQQYQGFLQNQNSLFGNYQNQLTNLANLGSQNTGATQAMSNSQLLAQLLSGANLATGQGQSANYMNTGNNIAQLLANQGYLNAGAYMNTGAAMGNNLFNGNVLTSQLNANAMASNAKTQSSQNNMNAYRGGLF